MNKNIVSVLILVSLVVPAFASADVSCGSLDPATGKIVQCGNGNPENVTNIWGGTNSSVPHVTPGTVVRDAAGIESVCPAFFTSYCVDITGTQYYIDGMRAAARSMQASGFALGKFGYWLIH